MSRAEADIREYLGICDRLSGGRLSDGMQSPYRFMLEHGRAFQVTEATYKGRRATPKQCYANAGRIMLRRPADLLYAEGYVTCMGLPIPHGWLVTRQGEVIEPTLKKGEERAYFGIAFDQLYYFEAVGRSDYWGMLTEHGVALQDIVYGRTEGMLATLCDPPPQAQ